MATYKSYPTGLGLFPSGILAEEDEGHKAIHIGQSLMVDLHRQLSAVVCVAGDDVYPV